MTGENYSREICLARNYEIKLRKRRAIPYVWKNEIPLIASMKLSQLRDYNSITRIKREGQFNQFVYCCDCYGEMKGLPLFFRPKYRFWPMGMRSWRLLEAILRFRSARDLGISQYGQIWIKYSRGRKMYIEYLIFQLNQFTFGTWS